MKLQIIALSLLLAVGTTTTPAIARDKVWKLYSFNTKGPLERRFESSWASYKECLEARAMFHAVHEATRRATCE